MGISAFLSRINTNLIRAVSFCHIHNSIFNYNSISSTIISINNNIICVCQINNFNNLPVNLNNNFISIFFNKFIYFSKNSSFCIEK